MHTREHATCCCRQPRRIHLIYQRLLLPLRAVMVRHTKADVPSIPPPVRRATLLAASDRARGTDVLVVATSTRLVEVRRLDHVAVFVAHVCE